MNNPPTDAEIAQAVDVINRIPKGVLPRELFFAISHKTVLSSIELLPIRTNTEGQPEVLLTQRPADDPYWPNMWHIAGTILRPTDQIGNFSSAFSRLFDEEFEGQLETIADPQYAKTEFLDTGRGRVNDRVYFVEIANKDISFASGKFFSPDALPENLIDHYDKLIPSVLEVYLHSKNR